MVGTCADRWGGEAGVVILKKAYRLKLLELVFFGLLHLDNPLMPIVGHLRLS